MNRNRTVLLGLLAAFVLVLPPAASPQIAPAPLPAALSPNKIPQFAQPLPVLGPGGIPVVLSTTPQINMCEYQQTILPPGTPLAAGANGKTWVWGYQVGDCAQNPGSYIGPVIVATRGTPTEVTYKNNLTNAQSTNIVAYKQATDQTLMWADPLSTTDVVNNNGFPPEVNFCHDWTTANPGMAPPGFCGVHYDGPIAAAPHLHGGEIPAMLDGGPDAWWTGNGVYGHGYYSRNGVADAALGKAVYRYPNGQPAAPIWFHDHTLGATRLNVYAGIAGAYMIVDPLFTQPAGMTPLGLANGTNPLDPALGELLVPIVLQDRMFDVNGQLLFPNLGINIEHPFWIPEFIGDTIVVNGKAWPFFNVEPKRYRFLVLNGSNARTYELFLINKATGIKGPAIYVIGTDQGHLDAPAKIDPNVKPNNVLLIMPGERYEVIIDFAAFAPGTRLLLANSAKAPYPAGAPPSGGTLGRIMELRVGACTSGFCGATDPSYNPALNTPIRTGADAIVRLADPVLGAPVPGLTVHKVRRLTLNEVIGPGGPLEILVNNSPYVGITYNGVTAMTRADFTPISTKWNTTYYSELPNEGETELWEIVNLTADAHPIHPHLQAFQVLNRQAFNVKGYNAVYAGAFPGMLYLPAYGPPLDYNCGGPAPGPGVINPATCTLGGNPDVTPFLLGAATPPVPSEAGWKDTVMSLPGMVTRILVRYTPTGLPASTPSTDPTAVYAFNPNGGHGFVWHCHIIDHEDNEMMRPLSVQVDPLVTRSYVRGVDY